MIKFLQIKAPPGILPLLIVLLLAGCSTKDKLNNATEDELWTKGQQALEGSNWPQSINVMQQIEAQYPFGRFASQSQLLLVYSYYMNNEPEATRTAADRFIRLYPDHPNIDYAYYLKGMAFYSEGGRFMGALDAY